MNLFAKKVTTVKLIILIISIFPLTGLNAQTCPVSQNQWQWPTHSNWYFGYHNLMSFGNGTAAPSTSSLTGAISWGEKVYESCATASDNDGNLVIMTNGVKLWDATGAEVAVPGGRLLTGAEIPNGDAGSAVQGVFITRHPLDIENYYIFTTDDAISGEQGNTYGFNYYIYNSVSNSVTAGPIRLADAGGTPYHSTEQIAGTFHANGVDIWVSTHESTTSGSQKFFSYLLTCDGLEETPVESSTGFVVLVNAGVGGRSNERASLEFSWDGTKAAGTYHNGSGTWDPAGAITIMDFDNLNGTFSNAQKVSPPDANHSNPYDCEWSPSGNRLFVSFQCLTGSEIGYVDVASGTYNAALNFDANRSGALKLGGDGKIYTGTFQDCGGWSYGTTVGAISNPDGLPSYDGSAITPSNNVGWGLGNMFIPPRDWVEIQDPGAVDECALPIDLETLWLCKGTDAENTPRYEAAYSVKLGEGTTINDTTGVFDAPGAGTYTVYFEICTIIDSLTFTIDPCGCEADVDGTASICAGETVNLDAFVVGQSGDAVWTIDSMPTSPGVDPTIDDMGVDTLFDASNVNTRYGIYKLKFTVDNSCEDSLYIEVKKNPTVVVDSIGPFCDDSVAVNMNAIPALGGDVVGGWAVNEVPQLTNLFDPIALGVGTHKVYYVVDSLGCLGADSINVLVKERPHPEITQVGPYCADYPAVTLTIIPANGDTGVWSGEVDALGRFVPSNAGAGDHDVFYTISGQCGNDTTIKIHVDAVKDATIATPDSIVCLSDPAVALTTGDLTGTWHVNDTTAGNELGGTSFDPAAYGAGVYDLIYFLPDPCGDLDTVEITVLPDADATVFNGDTSLCKDESAFVLNTVSTGGVWYKGDTLGGSELGTVDVDPADHDGVFNLYYYFDGRCGDVDSLEVTINPLKDATINTPNDSMSYCVLDPNPTFIVNQDGGSWNSAAVIQVGTDIEIDLTTLGITNDSMLIYTQPNPCAAADTIWVTTTNQLDATITQVGPFCDDADSVKLQVVDAGGTFSGPGVDPVTGWFDPVEASDGVHRITYTIPGNCGDVQFIDITVNRTPDPTITNTDFDFCEDHGDEALTIVEAGGVWSDVDNTNGGLDATNSIFNTVTSGDGSFRVRYGFAGACPAIDTVTFNITPLPVVSITPEDTLCEDNAILTLIASATPSTSSTWTNATATGEFDPSGNVGDNLITLAALNGTCAADSTINIHVLPRADASIDLVGPYCVTGGNTVLSPSSNDDIWSGVGITDSEIGIFSPSTAGAGLHTITRSIFGRCGDQQSIDIQVDGAPDVSFNAPPQVCAGSDPIQFTANNPGGVWSGDLNTDGTFDPVLGGTYKAVYSLSDLCFATDTIEFTVNAAPNTVLEAIPRTGCVPLDVTFNDISQDVAVSSSWDFGNSAVSNDLITTSNTYESAGCYDVTLTNVYANGCKGEYTLPDAVCTFENPRADFNWNPTKLDVEKNVASFNNLSSADVVAYNWDFTDIVQPAQSTNPPTQADIATSINANPTVTFNSPNGDIVNVELIVTNSNGCRDTVVKPITIIDKFSVYVANAFTPNGDGINETFFPKGRNLNLAENYEFRIYNRWGTLIWMSEVPYQGWDGTVTELAPTSGEIAQVDVYVWRLPVRDPFTGDDTVLVGRVSLIK